MTRLLMSPLFASHGTRHFKFPNAGKSSTFILCMQSLGLLRGSSKNTAFAVSHSRPSSSLWSLGARGLLRRSYFMTVEHHGGGSSLCLYSMSITEKACPPYYEAQLLILACRSKNLNINCFPFEEILPIINNSCVNISGLQLLDSADDHQIQALQLSSTGKGSAGGDLEGLQEAGGAKCDELSS